MKCSVKWTPSWQTSFHLPLLVLRLTCQNFSWWVRFSPWFQLNKYIPYDTYCEWHDMVSGIQAGSECKVHLWESLHKLSYQKNINHLKKCISDSTCFMKNSGSQICISTCKKIWQAKVLFSSLTPKILRRSQSSLFPSFPQYSHIPWPSPFPVVDCIKTFQKQERSESEARPPKRQKIHHGVLARRRGQPRGYEI